MTGRSGDALSHFNFQPSSNAVLTEISAGEFWRLARSAIRRILTTHWFHPHLHGGYERRARERTGAIRFICPLLA